MASSQEDTCASACLVRWACVVLLLGHVGSLPGVRPASGADLGEAAHVSAWRGASHVVTAAGDGLVGRCLVDRNEVDDGHERVDDLGI